MEKDFFVEDLTMAKKKKKLNSGDKGKRCEREIVKILNERFNTTSFSRTIGSGARIWQVGRNMPQHAKDTFTSDLVTPEKFNFSIESKGGYDDVDLTSAFDGGHSQIDEFLKQVQHDADGCGRKPLLVWKKNRKPRLAALKTTDLPHMNWDYRMVYRDWSIVAFDILLKEPDTFWFIQNP